MTPLLELPAVRRHLHRLSVETYRRLGEMGALSEDVELLRGLVVASAELDEGKASIYAEAGIPEYWMVRPDLRAVTVYREPSRDGYRTRCELSDQESLHCAGLPGVVLPVASVLPPQP